MKFYKKIDDIKFSFFNSMIVENKPNYINLKGEKINDRRRKFVQIYRFQWISSNWCDENLELLNGKILTFHFNNDNEFNLCESSQLVTIKNISNIKFKLLEIIKFENGKLKILLDVEDESETLFQKFLKDLEMREYNSKIFEKKGIKTSHHMFVTVDPSECIRLWLAIKDLIVIDEKYLHSFETLRKENNLE